MGVAEHWSGVWSRPAAASASWQQCRPTTSLRLVSGALPPQEAAVLDVGAGDARLVDELLDLGCPSVTVLDVAEPAVARVRARLAGRAGASFVVADLLRWSPDRRYDVWHDRAVLHFLVDEVDRQRYVAVATEAVRPGGALVLGAFAADGPASCSGLPVRGYDAEELAGLFPGTRLEVSEREQHLTPAGAVQPFTWVVLRRDDTYAGGYAAGPGHGTTTGAT